MRLRALQSFSSRLPATLAVAVIAGNLACVSHGEAAGRPQSEKKHPHSKHPVAASQPPATQPPQDAAKSDIPQKPEELLVVASAARRAAHNIEAETKRLQNVPQASTRVEAKQLRAEHMTSLPEATRLLPSVQLNVSNPRNSTINIRGLGAAGTAPTDGIEGGVSVYVDGVYRSRPATVLSDITDLDGITVLRGPAGTEGGMTATAGAISMTTSAPDLRQRHAYAEAGVGNFDYSRWNLGLTTPVIKDKLAIRLSALGYGNSGWVKNINGGGDINGQTSRAFRAQILYHPTNELSVRIIGDYSHLRENCCSGGLYKVVTRKNNGAVIAGNLYQRAAWAKYTPLTPSNAPYTIDRNSLSDAAQEDMGLSGQVDWKRGDLKLSSITAYRWWNWYPHNDGDLMGVNAVPNANGQVNQDQFTQELKLENNWRHILHYTIGGFYMWQENRVSGRNLYGPDAAKWWGYGISNTSVTTAQANNALNGFQVLSYGQPTTNYYALYTDGTWKVTRKFDIITGIRYNYDAKNGSFSQWIKAPASYSTAITPLAAAQSIWSAFGSNTGYGAHMDNGFVTGQFVLRYRLTDNVMTYARYAHGGKSGGLNLTAFSASQLTAGAVSPNVGKETDDSFEVGVKSQLLQDRLLLSGALYQTNDHNYQVTAVQNFQGALLSYLSSAPRVRIRGAEFDAHYSPLVNLTTSVSAAYTDAQFLEYQTNAPTEIAYTGAYDMAHTPIPFVSKWSLSASVQYVHPVLTLHRTAIDGFIGGSYQFKTDMNTSANNSSYAQVKGYGTLNLNFGVRTHDGRWELNGFIFNATNERRVTQINQSGAAAGLGSWTAYVTQPLNFGFIARVNY